MLLIGSDLEYSLFVYLKCLLREYKIHYDQAIWKWMLLKMKEI